MDGLLVLHAHLANLSRQQHNEDSPSPHYQALPGGMLHIAFNSSLSLTAKISVVLSSLELRSDVRGGSSVMPDLLHDGWKIACIRRGRIFPVYSCTSCFVELDVEAAGLTKSNCQFRFLQLIIAPSDIPLHHSRAPSCQHGPASFNYDIHCQWLMSKSRA